MELFEYLIVCLFAGKVWKPKDEDKVGGGGGQGGGGGGKPTTETEWDEVLAAATEEELVDLAGLFHRFYFFIAICCIALI